MKVYHGTSYENYLSIMEGKPVTENNRNWSVSRSGFIYLYGDDKRDSSCLESAYDNAILCAAIHKSEYKKVVVIELDIDEGELQVAESDDFINLFHNEWYIEYDEFIKRLKEAKIHYYRYIPEKRWMYLYNLYHSACCLNWNYAKDYVVDVDDVTSQCDKWYEENNEYEWHFRDEIPHMTEILLSGKIMHQDKDNRFLIIKNN